MQGGKNITMTRYDRYQRQPASADDNGMEIRDEGDSRSLYFRNEQLQSKMSLSTPHHLLLSYTRFMTLPLLPLGSVDNILVVGLGSGSFVRFFHHHFPRCRIDAVDPSENVIKAARGHFMLPENDLVRTHPADGHDFLRRCPDTRYDLILVDAFDASGMAPTIYNPDFLSLCSRKLTGSGWLSCNLWSNDKKKFAGIRGMLSRIFKGVVYLPVPDRGNIVAVAAGTGIPWGKILLPRNELHTVSKKFGFDFSEMVKIARGKNISLGARLSNIFQ
jgi:spermidine synthase